MENLSLTLSLLVAGLIIGFLATIAVGACIRSICEAFQAGSSHRWTGLITLMIYVPLLSYTMRNMVEVAPMILGILLSTSSLGMVFLISNIRAVRHQTTKNPSSSPSAG